MFKTKIIRNVVPLFVVATFVGLVGCKQPTNSISFGDKYYEVFWDENSKTATVRGNCDIGTINDALVNGYVTDIGDKIEKVVIEDGITGINSRTFTSYHRNLQSVSIPNSVTHIGYHAFYYCSNLASVTVNAVTPPTICYIFGRIYDADNVPDNGFIFDGCSALSKIYVPSGSVDTYKNHSQKSKTASVELGWKIYTDKIEAIN